MIENPFEIIERRFNRLESLIIDNFKLVCQNTMSEYGHDRWLDLNEYCNYNPAKPTKATVYSQVHDGIIPYHKKGKKLFFLKSEIDQWLKEGRRKTVAELQREVFQPKHKKRSSQ
jgi:hypothetical protein